MKKFWLSAIVVFALILTSCANPLELKAELGKEFTLPFGHTASFGEEHLRIKFSELVEDSRCPKGAVCIWAGRASVILDLDIRGNKYRAVLSEMGLIDGYAKETYEAYSFRYRVKPYPEVGKKFATEDYYLTVTVTK